MKNEYDVFLICPVRNATDAQKKAMEDYISFLEKDGKKEIKKIIKE